VIQSIPHGERPRRDPFDPGTGVHAIAAIRDACVSA
jgi:hypothetical protein